MGYISEIPGVSNVSLGQSSGANSTGSKELFPASQTAQNASNISENVAQFVADTMTMLLHVLRVFGRTPRTIEIIGQMVASKEIVLTDALKDFDEVVSIRAIPRWIHRRARPPSRKTDTSACRACISWHEGQRQR